MSTLLCLLTMSLKTGLSLELLGHFPITQGTLIRLSFIRWQNKTSKVKLNDVPFIVRRMQYWEGGYIA